MYAAAECFPVRESARHPQLSAHGGSDNDDSLLSDVTDDEPSLLRRLALPTLLAGGCLLLGLCALPLIMSTSEPTAAQVAAASPGLASARAGTAAASVPQFPQLSPSLRVPALQHVCNPAAALSGPVTPRRINVVGAWAEKCATLPHEGIWQPPAAWTQRNWCWVYMRTEANAERFKHNMHMKPDTWWNVQKEVSRHVKAPPPEEQQLLALERADLCDRVDNGKWNELKSEHSGADWDVAGRWFGLHVDVYVINLPSNVARLKRISDHLKDMNISWTHVDGVDLRSPGSLDKAKEDGLVPTSYDMDTVHANLKAQYEQSQSGYAKDAVAQIGKGTVGCSAAHLRAMRLAAAGTKPLALILEDDAELVDGFLLKLHALVQEELPCDWQALNLDMYEPYGRCVSPHLLRVQPDANEPKETCRQGGSWNFGSVLYRVSELSVIVDRLSAAVWNVSRPSCLVHDITFASLSDELVYYAVPAQQYPGLSTTFPKLLADVDREAINTR